MKRPFAATVWREGKWYVSQCLEVDVASQGDTEEEALVNLAEALGTSLRTASSNAAARCPSDRGRGWGGLGPSPSARSSAGLRRRASSRQAKRAAMSSLSGAPASRRHRHRAEEAGDPGRHAAEHSQPGPHRFRRLGQARLIASVSSKPRTPARATSPQRATGIATVAEWRRETRTGYPGGRAARLMLSKAFSINDLHGS